MPDEIPGINMLVLQNDTAIIAQNGATLSSSTELVEAITKSTNFVTKKSGDQDWTLSYEGEMTDSVGKHTLTNGEASMKVGRPSAIEGVDTGTSTFTLDEDRSANWSSGDPVRVYLSTGNDQEFTIDTVSGKDVTVQGTIPDSTADGRMFKPVVLPGLQSITMELDQELDDTPPGINEATGWTYYTPLRQDYTLEVEGHYYDPEDSDVYDRLHTARDNGNNLAFILNIIGIDFVGEIAADSIDVEAGTDSKTTYSLSYGGSEEIDKIGTAETTIDALISLFFDQTTATVSLRHREDGTDVTGSTIWKGDAYLATFELALERNAYPEISSEYQGSGSLNRNVA